MLEFYDRIRRLSELGRVNMLRAFNEVIPKIPARPAAAVDPEISELRRARRTGGRRTPGERR
jgi:hypothetical protein